MIRLTTIRHKKSDLIRKLSTKDLVKMKEKENEHLNPTIRKFELVVWWSVEENGHFFDLIFFWKKVYLILNQLIEFRGFYLFFDFIKKHNYVLYWLKIKTI